MARVPPQVAMNDKVRDDALAVDLLRQEDAAELDAFLALHAHSSMYLRAELRRAADRAEFAVARKQGRIVAAAAQSASGMILLQAPVGAGDVAAMALRNSRRRLAGFFGPVAQVRAARHAMGLDGTTLLKDAEEDLFALALSDLRLPPILAGNKVSCRVAGEADFDQLLAWRAAFRQAALGDVEGEHLEKASHADIAALLPAGSLFILETGPAFAAASRWPAAPSMRACPMRSRSATSGPRPNFAARAMRAPSWRARWASPPVAAS